MALLGIIYQRKQKENETSFAADTVIQTRLWSCLLEFNIGDQELLLPSSY